MAIKKTFDLIYFRKKKLPKQREIMASWDQGISSPVVSIICITFNHGDYIHDAIKGFLTQETSFPFEVIVHDDASKDETPEIVRYYARKYPNIIKPIFQEENQYSQGKRPLMIALPFSAGKYIALCEGDDFWVSSNKLQSQVSILEKSENINGIFSPCYVLDEVSGKQVGLKNFLAPYSFVLNAHRVIEGGGGVLPTPTFVLRRHILDNMPSWVEKTIAGDYYNQSFAAIPNGLVYSPFPVACYRKFSRNSVTTSFKKQGLIIIKEKLWRELSVMKNFESFVDKDLKNSVASRASAFAKESASVMLDMRDFDEFQLFIEKSWEIQKNSSAIQSIMYRFRKTPRALRFLYYIKSIKLANKRHKL